MPCKAYFIGALFDGPIGGGVATQIPRSPMHLPVAHTQTYDARYERCAAQACEREIAGEDSHTMALLSRGVVGIVAERGANPKYATPANQSRAGCKKPPTRHRSLVAAVELTICLGTCVFEVAAISLLVHPQVADHVGIALAYDGYARG